MSLEEFESFVDKFLATDVYVNSLINQGCKRRALNVFSERISKFYVDLEHEYFCCKRNKSMHNESFQDNDSNPHHKTFLHCQDSFYDLKSKLG